MGSFQEFCAAMEADPVTAEKLELALRRLYATNYSYFLSSPYWELIKLAVRERDKACIRCDSKVSLNTHHLHYDDVGREWRNLECVVLLCRGCHAHHHGLGPDPLDGCLERVGQLMGRLRPLDVPDPGLIPEQSPRES